MDRCFPMKHLCQRSKGGTSNESSQRHEVLLSLSRWWFPFQYRSWFRESWLMESAILADWLSCTNATTNLCVLIQQQQQRALFCLPDITFIYHYDKPRSRPQSTSVGPLQQTSAVVSIDHSVGFKHTTCDVFVWRGWKFHLYQIPWSHIQMHTSRTNMLCFLVT